MAFYQGTDASRKEETGGVGEGVWWGCRGDRELEKGCGGGVEDTGGDGEGVWWGCRGDRELEKGCGGGVEETGRWRRGVVGV